MPFAEPRALARPSDGTARCCDPGGGAPALDAEEMRCSCGSLLARVVRGFVELKCRRCKRTFLVPIDSSPEVTHSKSA